MWNDGEDTAQRVEPVEQGLQQWSPTRRDYVGRAAVRVGEREQRCDVAAVEVPAEAIRRASIALDPKGTAPVADRLEACCGHRFGGLVHSRLEVRADVSQTRLGLVAVHQAEWEAQARLSPDGAKRIPDVVQSPQPTRRVRPRKEARDPAVSALHELVSERHGAQLRAMRAATALTSRAMPRR